MNGQTRKVSIWIIVLAVLILFSWGYYYLHLPTTMPIKVVKVVGKYHFVNRQELQAMVMPYVERGFFNVNVAAAEKAMRQLPGVEKASIRRIWPDAVEISITEKKSEARLEGGRFLGTDGTIFKPKYHVAVQSLPLFVGEKSDLPQIKKMYNLANQQLKVDNLKVTSISFDDLGSWGIEVNNKVKIALGKSNIIHRLQEVAKAYPRLQKLHPGEVLAGLDMRYHQGLAVRFEKKDKKLSKTPILRSEPKESRIDYTQHLVVESRSVPQNV